MQGAPAETPSAPGPSRRRRRDKKPPDYPDATAHIQFVLRALEKLAADGVDVVNEPRETSLLGMVNEELSKISEKSKSKKKTTSLRSLKTAINDYYMPRRHPEEHAKRRRKQHSKSRHQPPSAT
jgi:hypothetical protein